MTKSNKNNNLDFRKELISIALPVALQSLMLSLVGASDALMLGRFSQDAVSAVSLANQISFIMNLFIGSVTGGCSSFITQYYGKKDNTAIQKFMSMGIKLCAGISLIFFIGAFFFPQVLMRIYTPDKNLIETGVEYLKVVSWSYLFSGITQIYLMVMKATGRAAKSAFISVMTAVIDMLADLFLIYGLAGFPRLGAAGCAISTVVVEACAFIVCIADSYGKGRIRPDRKSFFSHSQILYKDLAKVTLPALASNLTWGVGYSMRSMIMGHLGNDAVAADAVTSVLLELSTCFCKGLSSGATIMTGRLLGQNLIEEAKVCAAKFCKISFLCGVVNVAVLLITEPIAIAFFVLTDEARKYTVMMIFVSTAYLFAYSLNTIITCGIFPAGGDTMYDAKSVMLSKWCFSLPLALLGTFVFKLPVILVYVIVMSDETVKLPWLYPRYKKYIWVKNLTRNNV